jgi:hypothetical protein
MLVVCAIAVGFAVPLFAQQPAGSQWLPAEPVFTMGQPRSWRPYAAGLGVWGPSAVGAGALFGVQHPLTNPVTGLLGASGEIIGARASGTNDGGARLLLGMPALGIGAGLDWNATNHQLGAIFHFETAIRRGGIFGHGTTVRFDWLPARSQRFAAGIQVPLLQPFAGRTRPRDTEADLPGAGRRAGATADGPADAQKAFAAVEDAAARILAYTNLYSDENEQTLIRAPRTYDAAIQQYQHGLSAAFGAVAGDMETGETIAARARAGVLDDVILPYDALFGQVKEHDGDIRRLTARARSQFAIWLRDSSRVAEPARGGVVAVHERWLGVIEMVASRLDAQWKDSRLVWLPLQLALDPRQYDEQDAVDALVARAVGHPFTDHNALAYLRSADLPLEIARSIYAARSYHVLWTHDFTGRLPSGKLDEMGYSMVADAYLPALTAAVQRYDTSGSMPQYFVMADEFYYAARDGQLWMNILEDPLHASARLPGSDDAHEAHLAERLEALRAAVAHSARLQREAANQGGARWLTRVVAVRVNVTHPSDFTFRSRHIIPPLPFAPDNLMRDHRNIAFYDLTEANPYGGALIVTGVGIGEQYASASWEDRGYRLRGPAALEARAALRRTLVLQGVRDDQIPVPLRSVTAANTETVIRGFDARDYVGRVLQVHNEVGFGVKDASVARAMLYSLAPAGSIIVVPDPLWVSPTWAAMLAGAAARGAHVVIIAPAHANAPSPEPSIMTLERDVLDRLLHLRAALAGPIADAGGELRIGLYASTLPVTDVAGRIAEVRAGLARAPWIRALIPFDGRTLASLDGASAGTAHDGKDATDLAPDEGPHVPLLHQKTVFIARPGAIAALLRQPGWNEIFARAMRVQSRQSARFADQLGYVTPDVDSAAVRKADAMLLGYEAAMTADERKRVSFYFTVGTQNHDERGIMSDGEGALIVSGFDAAAGLVDLYYLMARTTWVEAPADVDRLVPPPSRFMSRIGHWFWATF